MRQGLTHRFDKVGVERRYRLAALMNGDAIEQYADRDMLPGIPARHRIVVMDREEFEAVERHVLELHRRREIAQQRRHRRRRDIGKTEHLALAVTPKDARAALRIALAVETGRHFIAVGAEETHRERHGHWRFVGLAGGWRDLLRHGQLVLPRCRIVMILDRNLWGAGLMVPEAEAGEIDAVPL